MVTHDDFMQFPAGANGDMLGRGPAPNAGQPYPVPVNAVRPHRTEADDVEIIDLDSDRTAVKDHTWGL